MKILKTIRDRDLGLNFEDPSIYTQERRASRAIVFDKDKNLALLDAKNKGYHKLPGGGIEKGEDIIEALNREAMEEIGCKITNAKELGIVEEYRNQFSLHQLSYCFIADLDGEKGVPQLEADEIEDGFEPVWLNIDEAIKILESEKNLEHYEGKFINMRDLILLKEAKKFI
jgi:8-oxo-dGTP diphosphatase